MSKGRADFLECNFFLGSKRLAQEGGLIQHVYYDEHNRLFEYIAVRAVDNFPKDEYPRTVHFVKTFEVSLSLNNEERESLYHTFGIDVQDDSELDIPIVGDIPKEDLARELRVLGIIFTFV